MRIISPFNTIARIVNTQWYSAWVCLPRDSIVITRVQLLRVVFVTFCCCNLYNSWQIVVNWTDLLSNRLKWSLGILARIIFFLKFFLGVTQAFQGLLSVDSRWWMFRSTRKMTEKMVKKIVNSSMMTVAKHSSISHMIGIIYWFYWDIRFRKLSDTIMYSKGIDLFLAKRQIF